MTCFPDFFVQSAWAVRLWKITAVYSAIAKKEEIMYNETAFRRKRKPGAMPGIGIAVSGKNPLETMRWQTTNSLNP